MEDKALTQSQTYHVLMLDYTYAIDDPRLRREAKSLANMGYEVTIFGAARQGGKKSRETIENVQFVLMPVFTTLTIISVLRMLGRLIIGDIGKVSPDVPQTSHKLRSAFTLIFINFWALRMGFSRRYDVVHSHNWHYLPAARLLRVLHRARSIHETHESPFVEFGNKQLSSLIQWFQFNTMRRSDAVITVGERLAHTLRENDVEDVTIIGNWRSIAEYQVNSVNVGAERKKLGVDNYNFVISYFGLFLKERSIIQLLESISSNPEIGLLIGGRGELAAIVEQYAQDYPNIRYFGWVPMQDIAHYNLVSDVIFYCLDANHTNQSYYSIPNKAFESLASGNAMIAIKGVGELAELMEQVGAAVFVEDNSVDAITDALRQLMDENYLKQLQENAFAARELYTWEMAEKRLATIYDHILSK